MGKVEGLLSTYEVERLVTTTQVSKWCLFPYPGHKHGCPNYGRQGCPPGALPLYETIDFGMPMYLVCASFDLDRQARKMKQRFPEWSERQCRCVLYWQATVRSELRRRAKAAMVSLNCNTYIYCPEGRGLNVFVTARLAGLNLEKTGRLKIDHHVALIGTARGEGKG